MGHNGHLTTFRRRQEQVRLRAAEMFNQGVQQAEVVRTLGVSRSAVSKWHTAWQERGREALEARPNTGRPSRLTDAQHDRLEQELLRGPRAQGYETELWTIARIGKLVTKLFGVRYHNSHVWLVMTKLGWSCQKPARRAKQRDEEAIENWRKVRWPRIKKGHSRQAP
jgi:transposase